MHFSVFVHHVRVEKPCDDFQFVKGFLQRRPGMCHSRKYFLMWSKFSISVQSWILFQAQKTVTTVAPSVTFRLTTAGLNDSSGGRLLIASSISYTLDLFFSYVKSCISQNFSRISSLCVSRLYSSFFEICCIPWAFRCWTRYSMPSNSKYCLVVLTKHLQA